MGAGYRLLENADAVTRPVAGDPRVGNAVILESANVMANGSFSGVAYAAYDLDDSGTMGPGGGSHTFADSAYGGAFYGPRELEAAGYWWPRALIRARAPSSAVSASGASDRAIDGARGRRAEGVGCPVLKPPGGLSASSSPKTRFAFARQEFHSEHPLAPLDEQVDEVRFPASIICASSRAAASSAVRLLHPRLALLRARVPCVERCPQNPQRPVFAPARRRDLRRRLATPNPLVFPGLAKFGALPSRARRRPYSCVWCVWCLHRIN